MSMLLCSSYSFGQIETSPLVVLSSLFGSDSFPFWVCLLLIALIFFISLLHFGG